MHLVGYHYTSIL